MSDLGFISITRVKHPTRWSWTRGAPLKSSMGMGYIVKVVEQCATDSYECQYQR